MKSRLRRTLAALTVPALLVVAAALMVHAAEPGRDESERDAVPAGSHAFNASTAIEARPRAQPDGFDEERLWSGYDDWEPFIATDPSSHFVYALTTRLAAPRPCEICARNAIMFRRSRDGGATWEADRFLLQTKISQYDPQIRVARDGTVFAAFLVEFRPGVTFMRSTDHGTTWSAPISFSGPQHIPHWSDRPALAISASGRDVYIGFNHSDSWVVASHDGGRTFAAPVKTSNDRRYYFHSAGAVAPDGRVYFAAQDYSQTYHGQVHIDVIRSSDGGRTWRMARVDTAFATPRCRSVPGCYFGFLGPVAGLAVDASGNLLMAYNIGNVAHYPQRLYVRTSRDGATWSPRIDISGTALGVENAFPVAAAGPGSGDFRVAWMDTRLGYWDVWYRRLNAGKWGPPVRLSKGGAGAPYVHSAGYDFPYGDYMGLSVDSAGIAHAIWGAGPNYKGPGGTWFTRGT